MWARQNFKQWMAQGRTGTLIHAMASRVYSLYCRPCSVLLVTTIDLPFNSQLVKWLKYLGAKLQRNYQI